MESTIAPTPAPVSIARSSSPATLWIALWAIMCLTFFGGFIGLAILIPTVNKVRERARDAVGISDLRQIAQASILWSAAHDGRLPPVQLTSDGEARGTGNATIHAVAAALAREGGLNEAHLWFADADPARSFAESGTPNLTVVLEPDNNIVNTEFSRQQAFAWDYVTGLDMSLPSTTPIAWTRGLRSDGTWDPDTSAQGGRGGYIAFLGGNVNFYESLATRPLADAAGRTTSNILATLPDTARVVGAGPGSLHGQFGLGEE